MPRALPIEVAEVVLDFVSDRGSLLATSLTCRDWRHYLFSRIFESVTIVIDRPSWMAVNPNTIVTPALRAIAPHVRQIRITAYSVYDNRQQRVLEGCVRSKDMAQLRRILPMFVNSTCLRMDTLLFDTISIACTVIALSGPVEHLELKDVLIAGNKYLTKRLRSDTRFAQLVSASIDVSQQWPLTWMGTSHARDRLANLSVTLCKKDKNELFILNPFLRRPGCVVENLEITLAATYLHPEDAHRGRQTMVRMAESNSSVKHFKISASHAYEASLVSAILGEFASRSLCQITLDLDIKEMHFPIRHEDDWERGVIHLMFRFPSLTRVDVNFRSCAPDITEEEKDVLRRGMRFLVMCDEHGILHATFISM